MPVLMVNGYTSEDAYSYSVPSHIHRHRWEGQDQELLLKKMVKEYDSMIRRGLISYYFINVIRLDINSEDLCSVEVYKKRVPLKEKVQLNASAKGKTPPRSLRFTTGGLAIGTAEPAAAPPPPPMAFFYSDTMPVTAETPTLNSL